MSLIPATILTGFLGSGKTTLLKRVLSEAHGQKIAVIENEFGEENIDSDILVSDTQEQIIQMSNGCICCTIREDLRATLQLLAAKKRKGLLDFDRVVIETTGLADPGPVAQTFFMDDEIAETYLLDSILTLVDAKHAAQQLNDRQEARRQVGFADQIFISKTDLVAQDETDALIHRLKHMNPRAPQKAVHFGEVRLDEVFDLRGFNLNAKLDIDPDFLKEDEDTIMTTTMSTASTATIRRTMRTRRPRATTITTTTTSRASCSSPTGPFDPAKLEDFLGAIVNIYGPRMLRYKGVLAHEGHRPQGDLPGRAPVDGQRPGPGLGRGREAQQQDGVHRHRPAERYLSAGAGAVPGLR